MVAEENSGLPTDLPHLPVHIRALLDPGFHLERPTRLELMQTQMSFVVIAGDFVYKLKKPVNLGYLDYTTLDKRRYFCEREVELNRRLCPAAYLGVLPVVSHDGKIGLGGPGDVIDYAVKMRYLPQDRMMNVLLAEDAVTDEMVGRVAQRLVDFHKRAETNATISAFGGTDAIRTNTEENFTQTEKSVGRTISPAKYERIRSYAQGFLRDNAALFARRVTNGRIRDCHGDLHAAHVCLTEDICIYDCIEFNERFRYGDVASEAAFLAMDLDHYGRADLSYAFVDSYVNSSGDTDLPRLLSFYKCYRAYVRGKVESFKLDDLYIPAKDKEQAGRAAVGYFDLAGFYARTKPALFATVGVTGTGKTTLARALARQVGLAVVSSDVVRKQLAGIPLTEHRFDEFDAGLYSADFSRRTYDTMFAQARELLSSGISVVLDATFIRSDDRRKAQALAREAGADFLVVECSLDDRVIRQWLARRSSGTTVSDGREEILGPQQRQFEPVTEMPQTEHIVIDTSQPMEFKIRQILQKVGES